MTGQHGDTGIFACADFAEVWASSTGIEASSGSHLPVRMLTLGATSSNAAVNMSLHSDHILSTPVAPK